MMAGMVQQKQTLRTATLKTNTKQRIILLLQVLCNFMPKSHLPSVKTSQTWRAKC